MTKGLHHIIFISFREGTPTHIQDEVYSRYQELDKQVGGEGAGIIFWSVKKNLDLRKNIHLIEYGIFLDDDSFQKFKKHPKHIELVEEFLVKHCDWHVGDFLLD